MIAKAGTRAIAFTSALSGEGKTTTAVNVALTLGRGGRNRVLLVDADLRRPSVHRMLGLRPRAGLADVVAGRAALRDCLWQFGQNQLHILPAGNVPDDLRDTLYHAHLGETFAEVKRNFDFVIVDAAPVLRFADVPTLCRDLDGVVLVVRARSTPRALVGAAIGALYGVTIHGLVLNDVDPRAIDAPSVAPILEEPRALPAAHT
jgi:capsular exopolysaccharide synthesis family protein